MKSKKIIVGILPQVTTKDDNNYYNDKNEFIDIYNKRIKECGATSIGLISLEQQVDEETLKLCDAFLIPGGVAANFCYFDVINYAIKNNIPLLGVCLGMQSLGIYSMFVNNSNEYQREDIINKFNDYNDTHNGLILDKIESNIIHSTKINKDNYKDSYHKINIIDNNSILYDVYRKNAFDAASLHHYQVKIVGKEFKITAKADDGVVEALEYNDPNYFILGVQFHPELDEENRLIRRLIKEGEKRNNG